MMIFSQSKEKLVIARSWSWRTGYLLRHSYNKQNWLSEKCIISPTALFVSSVLVE